MIKRALAAVSLSLTAFCVWEATALASSPPMAATEPPTAITPSGGCATPFRVSFTLNGEVVPQGVDTAWHFEYGPSTSYGMSTPSQDAGAGSAAVPVAVSTTKTGAGPFHYRLVASNADGVSTGQDEELPPQPPPSMRRDHPRAAPALSLPTHAPEAA